MRIVLERSNLLKSLNHVHRVVERRNTIPILSNVLLSATGASLELVNVVDDMSLAIAVDAYANYPNDVLATLRTEGQEVLTRRRSARQVKGFVPTPRCSTTSGATSKAFLRIPLN